MTQYVWPEWQGKSLEDILLLCRELVEDPTFPTARRWHAAGGKVVGHFQVYCPEEIIHAAGLLPLKIHGAPMEPVQADSRFGSYLCAILKTSLELALSRRLELDMFITPPICDAARNLAAVWGRNVAYPCQILYLPQNANSAYAVHYLRDEYARLARHLEALAGHAITAADLRHALAVFNENRALLRELYAIKRDTPWLLAVDEAYVCMAMGGLLRRDEHNALLRTVLPLIAQRPARRQDKIRVVFEGGFCEQPPPGHAAYHCAVVLCGGRRPADRPALDCQRCAAGRRCALQSGPGLSGSLVVQPGAA
jgi:benzoyl-CoA reductase subunit C